MTRRLPALGLEDTAARILAACAAREPQVDPWEASLPEPLDCEPWASDRAASALCDIAWAMVRVNDNRRALDHVRAAAAEARAWRLSLPEAQQGAPVDLSVKPRPNVRVALRQAIRALADADMSSGSARGRCIRDAEAYLRAAGEALIAQGAE